MTWKNDPRGSRSRRNRLSRHRTEARPVPADERANSDAGTLERRDLLQAPAVTLGARESRVQEVPHELDSQLGADHPRPERDDVHVVVLDTLVSREGIVT